MGIQELDRVNVSGEIHPALEMSLVDAARIFAAVGLFAADNKDARRQLAVIRVESDNSKAVIVATDSYALARFDTDEIDYTGQAFSLPAADIVKTLAGYAKTCKPMNRYGDPLRVSIVAGVRGYTVTVLGSGISSSGLLDEGQYPVWHKLVYDATTGTPAPFEAVGIGIEQLARLGKAAKLGAGPMVLEHYNGTRRALVFSQTYEMGTLTVLQMPERIDRK